MQPRKYGLDMFKVYHAGEKIVFPDDGMIFNWLEKGGLIFYEDYLFLMTLLSTSPNEFRLAFSVFDVNGDGLLDKSEFERVQDLVLKQSSVGQKHRDNFTQGISFKKSSSTCLTRHFFGQKHDQKLTVERFLQFQQDLHRDILRIEFERRDPESMPVGIISERAFADLLLIHAGLPEKRKTKMMNRVRRKYKKSENTRGVSFDECLDYFTFIYNIDRVDVALHFYKLAGKPLDESMLKNVAKKIAGVTLSDYLVDIIVTMFDENGDGYLSQNEFVAVMKKRMNRGLQQPKDTGVIRLFESLMTCSKQRLAHLFLPD
ncbi:unnamed protein product [Bursaphelenchus okinawaensis]|uniref:EF-hand domain-containing protein n=1 Tax=Bursaphelenchus okinawaensis TaxID=465554 RepID=A0A811K0L7_9BILA|nr:unnamed protein product [Bursaphelenchus okinawaensis]CAG9088272.1 unnamed protein product [Bursaphelenchus okinawaensis]